RHRDLDRALVERLHARRQVEADGLRDRRRGARDRDGLRVGTVDRGEVVRVALDGDHRRVDLDGGDLEAGGGRADDVRGHGHGLRAAVGEDLDLDVSPWRIDLDPRVDAELGARVVDRDERHELVDVDAGGVDRDRRLDLDDAVDPRL